MRFGAGFLAALLPTLSDAERQRLEQAVTDGAVLSIEVTGEPTTVRVVLTDAQGERTVAWSARVDFGTAQ
jgi:hypothetical protein